MDKKTLQSILSKPFELTDWRNLLTAVFGVKNFLTKPSEIPLKSNKKAESALELGSFNTADDRIIGLYLVKVKPEVWLERNKVGLRELLRSVYKYDVDGALIVFEQAEKWRLSFVSEIRTFDEEGNISKKITEPKRYTYLLGKGEKTKTPVDRLFSIAGKKLYLEEIRNAFSVEALNEEFYKIVARHFYKLVGATEGKGAKAITYDRVLSLPIGKPADNASKKIYQEFAVRLIGRTVFCWFLKVKKSDEGISLLPEHLLSSEAVKKNSNYYHSILEKLFFQTLNTPMPERWKELPDGCKQIPFLNGGLFEPQTEDYYKPNKTTGFSEHINTLTIPDEWFKEFFENLEQYNFTIDENSVVDIEVSVDPEMLGRIFENLLAEIDPDSGETARKATGSFYTPREIVDYMATESLVLYLHNQTQIDKDLLKPIFKIDSEVSFSKTDSEKILEALDRLKILDPACGSGAFPMGVLQKIVMALQKLDRNAEWWKARQINRIENALLRKQVKEKLELTTVEYARKIGVIQNTLYGVDIQPIAAEISKLRCFLTLVVDENIDETKPNRGVEPLPNLEFKFVTADALLQLPPEKDFGGLFNSNEDLEKLKEIRLDYLQSFGEHKNELKAEFKRIQDKIAKQQIRSGVANVNSRAFLISSWNPFSNEKVDWFDPLWMYGVNDFDIVIGNPPYVLISQETFNAKYRKNFSLQEGKPDLFRMFIESSNKFLNKKGVFSFIIPNSFLTIPNAKKLRENILTKQRITAVINFSDSVFKNASINSIVLITTKNTDNTELTDISNSATMKDLMDSRFHSVDQQVFLSNDKHEINIFATNTEQVILEKIRKESKSIQELGIDVTLGIQPYHNTIHSPSQIENRFIHSPKPKTNHYFLELGGREIKRYSLIPTYNSYVNWKEEFYTKPDLKFFNGCKVLLREIVGEKLTATYTCDFLVVNKSCYSFIHKSDQTILKYFLALLNSRLFGFWVSGSGDKSKQKLFPRITMNTIRKLPIKVKANYLLYSIVVDYILFLNAKDYNKNINEHVPNSHIAQLFEEVIDALVYELYFEEDFKNAGIEFMKYAQRDFKSIEGKSEKDAIETIEKAYQTLREKDNEIRNNLKLMDIKLADLIMPIKTSK
jgi:type I restriction-modification system DNA methylase subunit